VSRKKKFLKKEKKLGCRSIHRWGRR